ncbi:MAG: VWA domain-containing protein [Proteobacteria bacterium]|nr:VWA domain-containing protein [Pseudomonadota bacterium]
MARSDVRSSYMKLDKQTVAIVGCVGALVALGVGLERRTAAATEAHGERVVRPTPLAAPSAVGCGAGEAKASAPFARGTLTGALSIGKVMRGSTSEVHAAFDLTTGQAVLSDRPPLILALVIAHSGSMSGETIEAAKRAALGIVERLEDRDRVSLIQYDDNAEVSVPAIAVDQAGKTRLRAAIKAITIRGGTNLHAGMMLGHDEVRRTFAQGQISRVILLSDGQASDGITDPVQIAAAARTAADHGVRITAVGLGLDYNEDLMEAIAEAGRGSYYYVKDSSQLDQVMVGELKGVQATVATGVELRLANPCGAELVTVHGYESRREGDVTVIPMAELYGNDTRKLLVGLKLHVDKLGKLGALTGELRFHDPKTNEAKSVAIALAVTVTDDQEAASASVDKDVMAQVMSVEAAQTMRQAAAAYDRGDVGEATRLIDGTTAKLDADTTRYKMAPVAAAPALDSLREMKTAATSYAPTSEMGKNVLKASKAKARSMSK